MPGGVITCGIILAFFAFMLYLLTLESDTLTALKYSIFWFIFLGITYFMFIRKKTAQDNK